MKYEDLVINPEATVQEICRFVGVPYSDDYLNVPLVNPAEAKYKMVQNAPIGFDPSRLFNYTKVLAPSEIAALDMLVSTEQINQYYPHLPHRGKPVSIGTKLTAWWYIVTGPLSYALTKIKFARSNNSPLFRRTLQRLRSR